MPQQDNTTNGARFRIALIAVAAIFIHGTVAAGPATYTFVDLGTLGGSMRQAQAINNSGQIVGSAWTSGDASSHATAWNGKTILVGLVGVLDFPDFVVIEPVAAP